MSAEGAQAQIKRMEVISNNLANVNTPGFKRDVASFQARFAEAIERGQVPSGMGMPDDVGGGVRLYDVQTDFSSGSLKSTGRETDLAIAGEGYFQISTPQGTYLTRAGNFTRGTSGDLETEQGHKVLSETGTPIPLQTGWRLTQDGAIEQPGIGKIFLGLVKPAPDSPVTKVGYNLFTAEQVQPLPIAERRVLGGTLEMSGVNSTGSMMELIEASRAIEANMRMIQTQDNMLGSLVTRVLR